MAEYTPPKPGAEWPVLHADLRHREIAIILALDRYPFSLRQQVQILSGWSPEKPSPLVSDDAVACAAKAYQGFLRAIQEQSKGAGAVGVDIVQVIRGVKSDKDIPSALERIQSAPLTASLPDPAARRQNRAGPRGRPRRCRN
jgi:hypothetical protein